MTNTVTRLFEIRPDGTRRLMNTITPTSQFFGFPTPKDMHSPEVRQRVAETIRDGWIQNKGKSGKDFIIEDGPADPMVLSSMSSDIIRRSRENFGT